MNAEQTPLATPEGLRRFLSLNGEAVEAVVDRFYQTFPAFYETRGERAERHPGKISAITWGFSDRLWSSGSSGPSSITCGGSRSCWGCAASPMTT